MSHRCDNGHELATHQCVRCGKYLCDDCIVPLGEHSRVSKCPDCGDMARRLPDTRRRDAGFWAEVPAALIAPLRPPAAWVTFLGGALMCGAFSFYWIHPWAGAFAALTVGMYFNAYAAHIANVTAQGLAEDAYGWDLAGDWFNLLFFPTVRATLIFGGAIVGSGAAFGVEPLLGAAALTLAILWAPLAWLRVALTERLLDTLTPSTFRGLAMHSAITATLVVGTLAIVVPAAAYVVVPAAGKLVFAPLIGYGAIVSGRLLGLGYYHNAERVEWFGESARYYTPVR